MSNKTRSDENHNQQLCYEIRLKGHLDSQWIDWFGGMTIKLEKEGTTLIIGPIIDQAALHGLLKTVRDLGMPLVSICPIEPGPADQSDLNS